LKAVYETGKPTVAVLFNGRPLTLNWVAGHIPAIVETWFSGEKGGTAIADILLGKVNPSGKLSVSIPRSVGQIPFYYYHKPSSKHNYVDEKNTPLYAFGHGLSYTSFDYEELQVIPEKITPGGKAEVKIKIRNTGEREGTEIVQLYVRDEISSVALPVKALKGFQRVSLQPGESKEVSFRLDEEAFWLWNRDMKRIVEPGSFRILVGSASDDIRREGTLRIEE
jgi:beta-glucosidase